MSAHVLYTRTYTKIFIFLRMSAHVLCTPDWIYGRHEYCPLGVEKVEYQHTLAHMISEKTNIPPKHNLDEFSDDKMVENVL